ncbi:hypothetical protein QCA50_004993 [Cerrena zonata]|uniref:Uncharacterized protein n=1 Tax=Cerrena zonata TaxID=2478898 RepID=A0AAW0GKC0_9APHY
MVQYARNHRLEGSNRTTVKKASTYLTLDIKTVEERKRRDEGGRTGRGECSHPCGPVVRPYGKHVKRCNSNSRRRSWYPRFPSSIFLTDGIRECRCVALGANGDGLYIPSAPRFLLFFVFRVPDIGMSDDAPSNTLPKYGSK